MSVIEQAKTELALINFGEEDSKVMIDLLERFFQRWDSGGAVYAVAPILMKLLSAQPLTPLTGRDDEWQKLEYGADIWAQNKRCSEVFLRENGTAYTIERGRREDITFPYTPGRVLPASPVIEVQA